MNKTFMLIAIIVCIIASCARNDGSYSILVENVDPRDSQQILSFLRELDIKYKIEVKNHNINIKVPHNQNTLLQNYLSDPINKVKYIELVKGSTWGGDIKPNRGNIPLPYDKKPPEKNIPTVDEFFSGIFVDSKWDTYRADEYYIIIKFTGKIPANIREIPGGMASVKTLCNNNESVIMEIGPEGSWWSFEWKMQTDLENFEKSQFRVTPGRFFDKNRTSKTAIVYIDI